MPRQFGRRIQFDERSRKYPLLLKMFLLVTRTWECKKHLDQGNEGSCVGFGCGHELVAAPVEVDSVDYNYCRNIYKEAQKLDEFPGEYYEGTSVLAGLKVLKNAGWCDAYNWSFDFDTFLNGVSNEGPAIVGTSWYSGMSDTDENGFVHVTGSNEGGHCWLVKGINVEDEYLIGHNSWGTSWGMGGDFKISFADMKKLLAEDGEAAFLVGRHDPPVTPVDPESANSFWLWLWNLIKSLLGI
jgi:hypothetical protein